METLGLLHAIPVTSPSGQPVETWPGLELAAAERRLDALRLADGPDPRSTAAIYLAGYVIEMVVKVAIYRAMGISMNGNLNESLPEGDSPRRRAERSVRSNRGGGFHSLGALFGLLEYEREELGDPVDPFVLAAVRQRVLNASGAWREWLRYRHEAASMSEMREFIDGMNFIYELRSDLYRPGNPY